MREKESGETESRIKEVAKRLFIERGFEATKTRHIAEEAGVNIALLNYYFRSKENLFESILEESIQRYLRLLVEAMNEDLPLEIKIRKFVSRYIDLMRQEPNLTLFIMSEIHYRKNTNLKRFFSSEAQATSTLQKQLETEAAKGNIRSINPLQFELCISSMIAFPFITKPLTITVGNMTEADFNHFMEERKQIIADMVWAYLKS